METECNTRTELEEILAGCEACLFEALKGAYAPANTARALQGILQALRHPVHDVPRNTVDVLTRSLFHIGVDLHADLRGDIPDARLFLGIGAASNLVRLFGRSAEDLQQNEDPEVVRDRFDHTAALAAELTAIHHRRKIRDRGDLLRRCVEIEWAMRHAMPETQHVN